jgi:hypothetical protein
MLAVWTTHVARCGAFRPRSGYYRNAGWKDGLHPYCKACLLAYQRESRFEKLDRPNPDRQQWSRRHIHHDYFSEIDRAEKANHLGLLAADGNVLERVPSRARGEEFSPCSSTFATL